MVLLGIPFARSVISALYMGQRGRIHSYYYPPDLDAIPGHILILIYDSKHRSTSIDVPHLPSQTPVLPRLVAQSIFPFCLAFLSHVPLHLTKVQIRQFETLDC